MTNWDFDTAVIGAGAIGISVAAARAARGQTVLEMEAGNQPGEEATARNSEVNHAGSE